MRFLLAILLAVASAQATTYYVRTDGNNANTGTANTAGGAKLTIAGGEAVATAAGDVLRVQAGTYDEQPTISHSGSAGNLRTLIADGSVICRGFRFDTVTYVRVIGFEVTHNATTYADAIVFDNGVINHIEILGNNIHNTHAPHGAIICSSGNAPTVTYITIRGNTIADIGYKAAVFDDGPTVGISSYPITANHWLIEYNDISRCGDFINCFGGNHIIRNNYLHNYSDAFWPSVPANQFHSDSFQFGSDQISVVSHDQVYEANWSADQIESNSHCFLLQDTTASGDRNVILRGQVTANFGSAGAGIIAADHIATYNNTFYLMNQVSPASPVEIWRVWNPTTDNALNGFAVNTIFHTATDGHAPIDLDAGCTLTADHNWGYSSGAHASLLGTTDPLFVSTGSRNLRLQSGSPARGVGQSPITITTATGSGTSFNVNDGLLLCDGFGIADGDLITVGATTTRITAISGNAVTVAASVSWTVGDRLHWGVSATEDLGALPYASVALSAATMSNVGTTYTVTPTGDCRGVWFYADGVPVSWVNAAPFAATIASGTVTANAYAMYAQTTPVIAATVVVPPSPPRQAGGVRLNGGVSVNR